MRSFKIYDFTLSAGGAMPLLVEGGYFKIYSCTGVLSVSIDGGSSIGPINTGQGMKTEFKRLTIVDQSGAANVGKIIVASNEFVDGRISGEVSVIDGGKVRTLAGNAYFGYANTAAVAAQYAHSQLWNLAGSARNLIVKAMFLGSGTTQPLQLRSHTAQLPTLVGSPVSKRIGGAASTAAETRTTTNAAQLGTFLQFNAYAIAATNLTVLLEEPIVIPPGFGVMSVAGLVNTDCVAVFEFIEEAV